MNLIKIVLILSLFTVIIIGGIFYLLYKNQASLLFYPEVLPLDYQYDFPFPHEEVFLEPAPGIRLNAVFSPANKGTTKGVILYFHGNAGSLKDWGNIAPQFNILGYDIFIPDYRTYGKSTGKISEQALYDDAMFLYQHLLTQYDESKIVIYGRSLGTGIACELATKTNPRQLILETPFTGIQPLARQLFPKIIPIGFLLTYRFDNAEKLPQIKVPYHIFHGTADQVVPYTHGKTLAEISGKTNILTTIEGGQHNNLETFSAYQKQLKKLIVD